MRENHTSGNYRCIVSLDLTKPYLLMHREDHKVDVVMKLGIGECLELIKVRVILYGAYVPLHGRFQRSPWCDSGGGGGKPNIYIRNGSWCEQELAEAI